jgi:UDP-2,4-diacetamido-2,4,6-trideoxy-beta-L-altropyranose hydrolase
VGWITGFLMDEQQQEVFFKAKGSNKIGFGHIRRCLALIQSLPSTWRGALILDQPELLDEILSQHKVNVYPTTEFFERKHHNVKALIYDELTEDRDFIQKVRNKFRCRITALDYFNYVNPQVDVVINLFNQNTIISPSSSDLFEYYEGLQYSIIAPQFHKYRIADCQVKKNVEDLLIVMGGADPSAKTVDVLRFLASQKLPQNLHVNVVIGPLCIHEEVIRAESVLLNTQVTIHHSPSNLPGLMAKADLAISGCATTFFELSFLGTPAIVLSQNELEHRFCGFLEENGVAMYSQNDMLPVWSQMLLPERRSEFSRRQRKLFDGKGLYRILKCAGIYNDNKQSRETH